MSDFIELTALYRSSGSDPRDGYDRSQKRLWAISQIQVIYPDSRGHDYSIVRMVNGQEFVVAESYEYLSQILTYAQPRPA